MFSRRKLCTSRAFPDCPGVRAAVPGADQLEAVELLDLFERAIDRANALVERRRYDLDRRWFFHQELRDLLSRTVHIRFSVHSPIPTASVVS